MFNGKTHYKWQFSIAMLVYQRLFSPVETSFCNEFPLPRVITPDSLCIDRVIKGADTIWTL